jgi:WD40 repeat protein
MRPWALACAVIELSLAAGAGVPHAAPHKEASAKEIAKLIEQLGDDRFAKRQEASRALEGIGKPALRALRKASSSHTDLEVRWRAGRVFQAVAARLPGLVQKAKELHRIGWGYVHVFNTAFSPDGRFCVAGGDGGTLRLYHVLTGKLVKELVGHTGYTTHAVFTPNGKQILSASTDGTLRLWDLAAGKSVRTFSGHPGGAGSVDLSRDGKWAVSGGGDGTLRLWEVATGKEVRKFSGHAGGCVGLFTPDGKQILSAGSDRTMRLWDGATGKQVRKFSGHTGGLFGAFVLRGGKRALSYSTDGTARLWDLATGKEVRKLDLGPNLSDIRGLALSPDGTRILVGQDGTAVARLIDLVTGREVHRFALAGNPRGLSFSADGRLAASGSFRGAVYLWRTPGVFGLD